MNTPMLIGLAVLAYWLLSSKTSAPAPPASTAAAGTAPPAGGTTTVVTGTAPTTTTVTAPPPVTAPSGSSLPTSATAMNAFLTAAASGFSQGDPAITRPGSDLEASPFVWAFYLQNVALPQIKNATLDLTQAFPGVDLQQNMTPTQFWSGVGPQLVSSQVIQAPAMAGLGRMPAFAGRGGCAV